MDTESDVLCEKIINEIHAVFLKDPDLSTFEIIQTSTDHKNKSPVIHIDHNLGLESWCAKHVYDYAHKNIITMKFTKRYYQNDFIVKYINAALLINADVTTFWNIRRILFEKNKLNLQKEFDFSALVLTNKPKSSEAFAYRRWLYSFQSGESYDWPYEIGICDRCADKSGSNYHAWTHRQWVLERAPNLLRSEILLTEKFMKKHISDYSCYHYRQYVIEKLFELNYYDKEQEENDGDNHLIYLKDLINYYSVNIVQSIEDILKTLLPNFNKFHCDDDLIQSFLYCCNLTAYDIRLCDKMKNLYRPRLFETLDYHRRASLKFIVDHCVQLNNHYHHYMDMDNCCFSNYDQPLSKVSKFDYTNNEFLLGLKKSEGMLGERHRKWCTIFLGFDYTK